MKIAITGPSGSGKTTLARALAKRLGFPLGYWGSRYSAALLGFSGPYDSDKANLSTYIEYRASGATARAAAVCAQSAYRRNPGETCRALFQRTIRSSKIDHELSIRAFVTDRCYLDDQVYSDMAGSTAGSNVAAIMQTADTYGVLFYMPSSRFQSIDGDPARLSDPEYHAAFTAKLEKLIARVRMQPKGCEVIELSDPTADGVAEEAISHLNRLGFLDD